MKNKFLLPTSVTRQIFNKTTVTYSPQKIWGIFNDLSHGKPLDQNMTDQLFDFFLSIGILVILQKYPGKPVHYDPKDGSFTNGHQIEELMDIVIGMHNFFVNKPERVTDPKYYPTVPSTTSEERRFHAHFKSKGGNLWTDGWRKRQKDPLNRRLGEANDSFGKNKEEAEKRRTQFYNEAMSEIPDFMMLKTDAGYTTDLTKCCANDDLFKTLSEEACETINEIYFTEHLKNILPKIDYSSFSDIVSTIYKLEENIPVENHSTTDYCFDLSFKSPKDSPDIDIVLAIGDKKLDGNVLRRIRADKSDDNEVKIVTSKKIEESSTTEFRSELDGIENVSIIDNLELISKIKENYSSFSTTIKDLLTKTIHSDFL